MVPCPPWRGVVVSFEEKSEIFSDNYFSVPSFHVVVVGGHNYANDVCLVPVVDDRKRRNRMQF